MQTTDITAKQYAELKSVSLQYITKQLRDKKDLPGIIKVNKYGRFYLLTVDKTILKESSK